jgi:hypothetical protein
MLLLPFVGEEYNVGVSSNSIMSIPNIVKIGHLFQRLNGNPINLLPLVEKGE